MSDKTLVDTNPEEATEMRETFKLADGFNVTGIFLVNAPERKNPIHNSALTIMPLGRGKVWFIEAD
jgi:hypothetical protein